MKKGILVIASCLALAGCGSTSGVAKDKQATNLQLDRYQKNQPIPQSDWSQYRQTVIDVEMAQIHGVATTSFFFNLGVINPFKMCPSIGFPVATTSELTNPEQMIGNTRGNVTIGQQEPNGVYPGHSTGTYVTCVAPSGKKYHSYWEGWVDAEGGPAHWDAGKAQVVLDGTPTVGATGQ